MNLNISYRPTGVEFVSCMYVCMYVMMLSFEMLNPVTWAQPELIDIRMHCRDYISVIYILL